MSEVQQRARVTMEDAESRVLKPNPLVLFLSSISSYLRSWFVKDQEDFTPVELGPTWKDIGENRSQD